MARKHKIGIDYFSHDVDMVNDRKLKLLKAKHGLIGYAIYLRLLEELYRDKGYYLKRDEEFDLIFANDNNVDINVYINVINDCINYELFDKKRHDAYNILTSRRIQSNYLDACKRRKSVDLVKEYLLAKPSELLGDDKIINVNINSLNADKSTQRKEKKKESKENERKEKTPLETAVDDFIDYRKQSGSKMTDRAIKLLMTELDKLASKDEEKIAILEQSIMNGWKGVFELKGGKGNGKGYGNNKPKTKREIIDATDTSGSEYI